MDERIDPSREDLVAFNRTVRNKRAAHHPEATQLQTLGYRDREGSMSARTLAQLERVTPQLITRTVLGLEGLGLVSRIIDPQVARANIVSITDADYRTSVGDRARQSEWMAAVLDVEYTDAERELLYTVVRFLRMISENSTIATRSKTLARA